MQPKVSIIIVTWNNASDIEDCLRSVANLNYPNYSVTVIDSASGDGTADIVAESFPEFELVRSPKNLYFAGGNNLGIHKAIENGAEFVSLLNPDTIVESNWLTELVSLAVQDTKIGIVGSKVCFAPGFGADGDHLTSTNHCYLNTVGILPGGFLFPYDRGYGELDNKQYENKEEVFAVSGVSMLLRAQMLKEIGTFFAPMQMYLEDVDLCVRAKKQGWQVWYAPESVVWHKHMQSTGKQKSSKYFFWSRRNYLLYIARNYPMRRMLRATHEVWKEAGMIKSLQIFTSFIIIQSLSKLFNLK